MSGDAAPGSVSSPAAPSSSPDARSLSPSMRPEAVKAALTPVAGEVSAPADTEPDAKPDAKPDAVPEATVNHVFKPELKEAAASTSAAAAASAAFMEYMECETLPQPQAPPVMQPAFESEEIVSFVCDASAPATAPARASAVAETPSSPPTMTSALASSLIFTQAPASISPAPPTPSAPPALPAPIIAPPTTPLALHPIRSSGPGGPLLGSNPKHAKQPAKAAPSEKPAETAASGNSLSAKKPLTLLQLPVDILRLIVKEVDHHTFLSLFLLSPTLPHPFFLKKKKTSCPLLSFVLTPRSRIQTT